MGLFSKKKREYLPADISESIEKLAEERAAQQPANYISTLDWLLGLSDKEYIKMQKVVDIYRKANSETAKALNIKTEPTSFLPQPDTTDPIPQDVNNLASGNNTKDAEEELDDFLNDDLSSEFLEDEPRITTRHERRNDAKATGKKPDVKAEDEKLKS